MGYRLATGCSSLAVAAASLAFVANPALAQDAGTVTVANGQSDEEENVIIVSGVRQSIETSIDDKRNATEIKDSITAEDIGQLANDNISEALQRIAGVQVTRSDDGEGSGVQIRGLSENNVLLDGESLSGSAADRGVNFQDIPSELFSSVEILKTPTADSIEGTLGGTINLRTRAPLTGNKDFILNVNGAYQHGETGSTDTVNANGFLAKQFRDTGIGDIGILLNVAYRETSTVSEVYGGGDFDDAPGIWARLSGATVPPGPFRTNALYGYDGNIDTNGDGLSDENDVFYVPNGFGFFERTRDSDRISFRGTLEWEPSDAFNLRFDATIADVDESLTGSRYSINFNRARTAPLLNGPGNVFAQLGDTPELGPVFYLQSGRLGAATNRIGASPSENFVSRRNQDYSLELDWQVADRLNLFVRGSTSTGRARTDSQGALVTGIDQNGNGVLNADDFRNVVDYDLSGGPIPDATFYESPFPSPLYGVTALVPLDQLVVLDPSNINYERQRYFQFNRVAQDTRNTNDALRFDLTWEQDGGFFTDFKAGFRWAERSFERTSWQNPNQRGAFPSVLSTGGDPNLRINVQNIPVDPNATVNPDIAAASTFLGQCITQGGNPGLLSSFGGNLPRTWGSTAGCPVSELEAAFNLIDIRAVNPDTGVGFYERTGLRFDVSEETVAAYLRADFLTSIFGGVEFYGNVGLRYVETDTNSSGFIRDADGDFQTVSLPGSYNDWLPSANLNFALTDELILRLAYTRTLGRPGLSLISPALTVTRNDENEGFDGTGSSGNPDLDPVRSDNLDASLEWYYDKGSYASVAVFQKDIDSTIFLGEEQVPLQVGDERFLVRTFGNFGGTKIRGVEFGMSHAFNYLPGSLSNLGLEANYTIVDESSDLVDQEGDPISRRGLSDNVLNVAGYYDDGRFSVRLAYNKRSEFTRRENVTLGFGSSSTLPEIEAGREQLDLAVRYRVTDKLRFTFNAINLTDEGTFRYLKYDQLTNYLAFAGRRYNFGVAYNF